MTDAMEQAFLAHSNGLQAALCDPGALFNAGCWPHVMTIASSSRDTRLAALELDAAPMEAFAARLTAAEVQQQGAAELVARWKTTGAGNTSRCIFRHSKATSIEHGMFCIAVTAARPINLDVN